MGIRYNEQGGQFAGFERRVSKRFDEQLDDVMFEMADVMKDGATEMQHRISVAGVEDTVATGGQRGSGRMYSKVTSRVWRVGQDIVRGSFGWPSGITGRQREIYGWQESGTLFEGEPSGMPKPPDAPSNRGIRPMLALYESTRHVEEELRSRFRGRSFRETGLRDDG